MWEQGQYLRLVIVGGGPAGLAPLLAAHRTGELGALLDAGVAVVEQSEHLGAGSIGGYAINSDSSGRTFVDCLLGKETTELTRLADHPLTRLLAEAGDGAVALRDAGQFLRLVGEAMGRMVAGHPASSVLTTHRATSVTQAAGGWSVRVRDLATGAERTLLTRHVVLATGAEQPAARLAAETVAGVNLVQRCAGRLLQSGDVLSAGGLAQMADLLAGKPAPRVVVVGGSTSAAAVAHALLHRLPSVEFGAGGVTLLHRRELRVYYPDRASALAEGYAEWTEDDVCPVSGKVFRFAGFRLDARELVMQARGIGGRPPEPRLRLHRLSADDAGAVRLLDGADLVVAALGYRPRAVPVHGRDGQPVTLLSQAGPQSPLVDGRCRVLDDDGRPVPGLFGIGLGAGFVPRGSLGGEASFRGQANGLWLWQHDVGSLIVSAVLRPSGASGLQAPQPSHRGGRPTMPVPLIRPDPPRLSEAAARLREIEDSGVFSNFGPVNTEFEHDLAARLFAGEGACVTVCNATVGLMLAVQHAIGARPVQRRFALMPSFTFAAAAQAALWCGLTPLFCDIDPKTWTACAADEERLLARHGRDIAVVMPYATFGYDLDLSRYERLAWRHGVPVVVDAAASLGTASADGRGFGTGFNGLVVYSMHATKSFAAGEGGIIYSVDRDAIARLRQMCNFGFGQPRTATMPGLNGKLSEVGALLAHLRLQGYDKVLAHRAALMRGYRQALPELTYQPERPGMQAHQFAPGLLPPALAPFRGEIAAALAGQGIGSASYFSPHLLQQDYFIAHGVGQALPVTDDVASRIVSLPLFDGMTQLDLIEVATAMRQELARAMRTAGRGGSRRTRLPAPPPVALAQRTPPQRTPAQT